jgi:outer membrane protein
MFGRGKISGFKKVACAACIAMLSRPVLAEDLMDVYRKAMLSDPQLLSAQHAHSAAGESVKESVGRMLPQLGFEYSRSNTTQDVKASTNALQPVGKKAFITKDYSLTLTQPLFNWSIYATYEQSKADLQRADAEFASKQQDLILQSAERYLETLAAEDQLNLAEAEKLALKRHLDLVQGMMSSGMARKTELYDAQARYANAEATEISARSDQDDKLQALREMVGELSGSLAMLKDDLKLVEPEPHDPESWMKAATEQNPRVILQDRAVEVSRYDVSLQKAGHYPTLDLTARLNDHNSEDSVLLSGASDVETRDIMLRLNIPIFEGGIVNSRTRRSEQLHEKALQDLIETRRAVQRAARAAYFGIISSISKVEALAVSVKSQELALQAKEQGFRSGLYTSLDVLDAQREAYVAKRDYARARYDYLLNSLRLKHAAGTLNEADIEAINLWLKS